MMLDNLHDLSNFLVAFSFLDGLCDTVQEMSFHPQQRDLL